MFWLHNNSKIQKNMCYYTFIPPKRGKGNTEVNRVGYVVQRLGDFVFGWKMNTSKGLLARVNVSGNMMGGCDVRGYEIRIHH